MIVDVDGSMQLLRGSDAVYNPAAPILDVLVTIRRSVAKHDLAEARRETAGPSVLVMYKCFGEKVIGVLNSHISYFNEATSLCVITFAHRLTNAGSKITEYSSTYW